MSDPIGIDDDAEDWLTRVTAYYLMGVAILLLGAGLIRSGIYPGFGYRCNCLVVRVPRRQ